VGFTREVETPLPSNRPHEHMRLRVDLGGGLHTREVETPLPSNRPHEHMRLRVDLCGLLTREVETP
jgi:hypothetical protein